MIGCGPTPEGLELGIVLALALLLVLVVASALAFRYAAVREENRPPKRERVVLHQARQKRRNRR